MNCLLLVFLVVQLVTSCRCSGAPDTDDHGYHRRSDDDALGALETLVQNQAMTISRMEADMAAYKTQMEANMAAYKTGMTGELNSYKAKVDALQRRLDVASKSVAFTARISSGRDNQGHGVSLTQGQTVIFDDVITNVGRAYHPQDGIFVAPVNGTYSFFLEVMGTNTNGGVSVDIVKNGATLDTVYVEGSSDAYDQGVSQVTTRLSVGDHVWARVEYGDAIRGDRWTVFTGFLLQAD